MNSPTLHLSVFQNMQLITTYSIIIIIIFWLFLSPIHSKRNNIFINKKKTLHSHRKAAMCMTIKMQKLKCKNMLEFSLTIDVMQCLKLLLGFAYSDSLFRRRHYRNFLCRRIFGPWCSSRNKRPDRNCTDSVDIVLKKERES